MNDNSFKLKHAPVTRIPRVAIVGTGFVGSTTAYALLLSGTPAEIVLIDRDKRRAEGHVQDLRDAEVFTHTTRIGDFRLHFERALCLTGCEAKRRSAQLTGTPTDNEDTLAFSVLQNIRPMIETVPFEQAAGTVV
jgi:D-arabinose 1-dehydrogenase-like Zn-dependent alcohol dehydrogenase